MFGQATPSQLWSCKISLTTFLSFMKFVDLPILRLKNSEKAGRVPRGNQAATKSLSLMCRVRNWNLKYGQQRQVPRLKFKVTAKSDIRLSC